MYDYLSAGIGILCITIAVVAISNSSSEIKTICHEGHEYIIKDYGIANKLNNDGTPVQCQL